MGVIINTNMSLHSYGYRISFYGFEQKGNTVVPVVKLRKTFRDDDTGIDRYDDGLDLTLELGHAIRFTDEDISRVMRQRWCK